MKPTTPRLRSLFPALILLFALQPACSCDGAGTDGATPTDSATSADSGPGTDSGNAGADSGPGTDAGPPVLCMNLLLEDLASASVIPSPAGPVPGAGMPFTIPETGVEVVRISDVGDPMAGGSFFTNGYSRWSPASITGEYVTAFGSGGDSVIYRLSDRTIVATLPVGEPNELHWDSSGAPGTATTIYYRVGAELRRVEVLSGTDELVHDFAVDYPGAAHALNGVEGAPSLDMRYWAFQICSGMTGGGQCTGLMDIVVYDEQTDVIAGRISDVQGSFPIPNFVEISPSGSRIVVGTCKENGGTPAPWDGPYAWSLDFSSNVRLSTGCTHSGWAWGDAGEEYYVSYDPCGASNEEVTPTCDYMMAVDINDPSGWANRFGILYQGDIGWGNSNHIGRIYDSGVSGWFFMSTYGGTGDWASHQLLFIELVPEASNPRIWRVSPTFTADAGYWTEAFASLDFAGQHVYWGANWEGQGNLELYRATLCDRWWEALDAL